MPLHKAFLWTGSVSGVAILLAAGLLFPAPHVTLERFPERSSYNQGPSGVRGWYLSLQKADIPVLRWEKPVHDLKSLHTPVTLICIEPHTLAPQGPSFSPIEAEQILSFVAQGNTLVLLDDFRKPGARYIAQRLRLTPQNLPRGATTLEVLISANPANVSLNRFVTQPLLSGTSQIFRKAAPSTILLQTRQQQAVLLKIPYRQGVIIAGTTTDLVSNRFLHRSPANDNFQWFSNLLQQEKKPLYLNEFVHGYSNTPDVWAYLTKQTPLGLIAIQLLLLLFLTLWLSTRPWPTPPKHFGIQQSPQSRSRKRATTVAQQLAYAACRTQASPLALAPLLEQIQRTIRLKFGIELSNSEQLTSLLTLVFFDNNSSSLERNDAQTALQNLETAQTVVREQTRLPHKETLRLSRELIGIHERLQQHDGRRIRLNRR